MVSQVVQQLLKFTKWGALDHLVLDLPPGTGDIQLTLGQSVPITTAVVVSTPQKVAFADVKKGLQMFQTLRIPTSAFVLNMAYFRAPDTLKVYHPFGTQGEENQRTIAKEFRMSADQLYSIPIVPAVSEVSDRGTPFMLQDPVSLEGPSKDVFDTFDTMAGNVALAAASVAASADARAAAVREGTQAQAGTPAAGSVKFDAQRGKIVHRSFDGDSATEALLAPLEVRLSCRCAACIDEMSGASRINREKIPKSVVPASIEPKGNYGVAIAWSDGHASSIYTFQQLEELSKGGGK
jgi:DUF971 family protein